jgi:MscS family membrane protein
MNTLKDLLQNEYFKSGLYLVGSIILARIIHFVLKKYVTALTRKTKSDLDDLLLKILIKPIYLVMILVGIYLSLNSLSIPEPYPKWINGTLFTLMAILIAWVISRVLALFVTREMKVQSGQEKTPKLINKVIAIVVYIIALLMILKYFNIEISPLVATLGLGGVAAGLALQKTLQNLLAGLHIISEQPIKVGDFIELPADNI